MDSRIRASSAARASRPRTASVWMAGPKRTSIRLRNQRSVLPTIAHGRTGTPEETAKAAAPSSNGRSSLSRKPMRPSAKMPSTPSASKTRRTARTADVRVVFSGL